MSTWKEKYLRFVDREVKERNLVDSKLFLSPWVIETVQDEDIYKELMYIHFLSEFNLNVEREDVF